MKLKVTPKPPEYDAIKWTGGNAEDIAEFTFNPHVRVVKPGQALEFKCGGDDFRVPLGYTIVRLPAWKFQVISPEALDEQYDQDIFIDLSDSP